MCVPLWPPLGKGGLFPILSHRLRSLDARAAKGKRTAWTPDPDVGEDLAPSRRRSTILQENSEANPHISADPPHFIDAIVPCPAGRPQGSPLRVRPRRAIRESEPRCCRVFSRVRRDDPCGRPRSPCRGRSRTARDDRVFHRLGGRFVNRNYGVAVFPIARVGATLAVARVPPVGAVHERPANFAPCTAPAGDS